MLAGNELNDREWATLVWLAIVIVLLLWSKRTRRPVLVLVRTATTSLLAVLAAGLWIWTAGVVWFGERVHLWTGDLLKDTVIWALGPALALIYGLGPSDSNFFRRAVLGTVRISVLVEFYVNLHVFGFIQELVLLPVVTAVALLAQFAGTDEKYRATKRLFNVILGCTGLVVLAYVSVTLIARMASRGSTPRCSRTRIAGVAHDRGSPLPVWPQPILQLPSGISAARLVVKGRDRCPQSEAGPTA